MATGKDGDEQLLEHALLADDDLAHLLADAAVAVVQPFDGGQVSLDARPGLDRHGFLEDLRLGKVGVVGRQPGAAAAQPATAGRHLKGKPTFLAANVHASWSGTAEPAA